MLRRYTKLSKNMLSEKSTETTNLHYCFLNLVLLSYICDYFSELHSYTIVCFILFSLTISYIFVMNTSILKFMFV